MALLLLALSLTANLPHAGSISRTWIEIQPGVLQLRAELQILSLLEILPNLDANDDGFVQASEVEAHGEALGRYLAEHYGLSADGEPVDQGALEVSLLPPTPGSFLPLPEWVEVRWEAPLRGLPQALEVRSTLFASTSPDHRDLLSLRWPGCLAQHTVLDGGHTTGSFEPGPKLLPLASRAALEAAWSGGVGALLALSLLLSWSAAGLRMRHASLLACGFLMSGGLLALLGREAATGLYGAHLWPLAVPLLAAYCAADRVAFGVNNKHSLEAFAGGHIWGMLCSLAWLRASAPWELEGRGWSLLPTLAPLAVLGGAWLLAKALHSQLQARAGRGLLALAGVLALGFFARVALA